MIEAWLPKIHLQSGVVNLSKVVGSSNLCLVLVFGETEH